jgi:hypothetical protein
VLQQVLSGADARGWSVSLQVFPESRARALYLRLGFAPLRMAGDRLCMQRPAQQPPLSKSHQLSPASGFPEPPLPLRDAETGPATLAEAGKNNH